MKYFEHPLNDISRGIQQSPLDPEDKTPADFLAVLGPGFRQKVKNAIGNRIYPLKNRLERGKALRLAGLSEQSFDESFPRPDTITLGMRGSGPEIFYRNLRRRLPRPEVVINFGCGLGYEVMQSALYLRPRLIIGCEYFNYGRAWAYVTEEVQRRYGVEVRFEQLDLRNPIPAEIPQADLLLSFAVLEHLKEMDASLEKLKQFLRPGGRFGSIWGPMWYSYSGDHIAAELGFEHGFDHVLLDDSDYFEFYKSHPRNRDAVRNNEKTWLELGLSNFARYQEYLDSVRRIFGQPTYLLWQLSDEAMKYKNQYPERWKQMLAARPYLTQLDLMLNSVGALT